MKTLNRTVLCVALALLALGTTLSAASEGARPNVILLPADDVHRDCLGFAGDPLIKTPSIDRLASRGVVFRNSEPCISRQDALRLDTIRNAALGFEEKEMGSLEPGSGKEPSSGQALAQLNHVENKYRQILIQPEIGPYFYQQTISYDGLAKERSLVKDKLAKAKTAQDKREAVSLDGLLKKKEEVLSDLKTHLEKISGKEFQVADNIPHSGIVLVRTGSKNVPANMKKRLAGKGLEAFLIRSEKTDRLWIVANDPRGLSHGVYYYLEQLGVRWLMAGKNWTVIPRRNGIAINIDRMQSGTENGPLDRGRTHCRLEGHNRSQSDGQV